MSEERLLYRPDEAARVIGVSRSRLYELLASGEIRSVKIGRSRRVLGDALRGYVRHLQEIESADEDSGPSDVASSVQARGTKRETAS